jgi:hypothetical protein
MNSDSMITVVSGLPRSGTSLMMQMLHAGGMKVLTDQIREADVDNPRGYFEWERAKQIEHDRSWLVDARGKAFKMISQLLYHLPEVEQYRIIFMRRDIDEILASQDKMLKRREAVGAPHDQIRDAFLTHLDTVINWLIGRPHMQVLFVQYGQLLSDPMSGAVEVNAFLDNRLHTNQMARAIDPSLYRNRNSVANAHRDNA